MFSVVTLEHGLPLRSSSANETRLLLNSAFQRNTVAQDEASFPNAYCNRSIH
ncbi:unnamed protein product [Acanthoscelides obtectus]|uniref:Uncharacterized protein n=1 Tax=Acanthoscelides obtectus TaxID=200917 RepID=A0A9P0JJM3_ACAOB|nr:unnamed protein product [Acanthoscelides obtectus]CAK1639908.1 hypothetical protein AOBTE_LOCUS11442 [Acanthoscelides obtectus]